MFLADIEGFDPDPRASGAYTKFMCNQPACEGKPDDAIHKSLSVNMETGVWHCFRCAAHGILEDDIFDDEIPWVGGPMPVSDRKASRQRIKSKFAVADPD